jgi:hypothetical protein
MRSQLLADDLPCHVRLDGRGLSATCRAARIPQIWGFKVAADHRLSPTKKSGKSRFTFDAFNAFRRKDRMMP